MYAKRENIHKREKNELLLKCMQRNASTLSHFFSRTNFAPFYPTLSHKHTHTFLKSFPCQRKKSINNFFLFFLICALSHINSSVTPKVFQSNAEYRIGLGKKRKRERERKKSKIKKEKYQQCFMENFHHLLN